MVRCTFGLAGQSIDGCHDWLAVSEARLEPSGHLQLHTCTGQVVRQHGHRRFRILSLLVVHVTSRRRRSGGREFGSVWGWRGVRRKIARGARKRRGPTQRQT